MNYEEMKAELAGTFYCRIKALTDRGADLSPRITKEYLEWLVEMFLRFAPDHYAAALQAGNTARGKTASEIEAELNKRSD